MTATEKLEKPNTVDPEHIDPDTGTDPEGTPVDNPSG